MVSHRISFPAWTVPFTLLIVVIAAYGLFAGQQGIHWDDWAFVWIPAFLGKAGIIQYFSVARPFWGYFYVMTTSLIGTNLLGWQVFAIIWQWFASVALWWTLRLAWPRNPHAVFFMTLFAVLYPGFSQHSIAITYGHFFLIFTFFFLSFALMLFGQRYPTYYWPALIGGVLCSAVNLFSLEYYFGIELLRPLLLWMVISDITPDKRAQLKRTLLAYLPYGFVLACFILWRMVGFHSQIYQFHLFSASGSGIVQSLIALLGEAVKAIGASSVEAWWGIFHIPPMSEMGLSLSIIYILLSLGSFVGLMFYVLRSQSPEDENALGAASKVIRQWLIFGGCAILTAGIPFYIVGLQVRLVFPADRLTQPFALGTAIVIVALLYLIPSNSWRVGIAALLAALAIGLQFQYGFAFRQDWRMQKSYFWQLSWRAPAIQPGTAILSENTIFPYTDDDALTLPLNWIYWPTGKSGSLPYAQKFFSVNAGSAISLQPGSPIVMPKNVYNFKGSTNAVLVAQFNPPSCLHILNPLYDADLPLAPASGETYRTLSAFAFPMLGRKAAIALPLSKPDLIEASANPPASLPDIFGSEPIHNWCYYYEKADLARQGKDWSRVASLGDKAFAIPYYPDDQSEYLPFIEAYAHIKRWNDAQKLTFSTADSMPILKPALCALWQRVDADSSLSTQEHDTINKVERRLNYCPTH